jgi:hypothetical protein
MALSNAERQRRWVERLKARAAAGGVSDATVSNDAKATSSASVSNAEMAALKSKLAAETELRAKLQREVDKLQGKEREVEVRRLCSRVAELEAEVLRNPPAGPSPEELRNLTFDELLKLKRSRKEPTPIRDEFDRRCQLGPQRGAYDLKILRQRVVAAHPDKGGTHQEAVKATAAFNAFKDRLKREEQQRAADAAAEAARREKQRAARERKKAAQGVQ